MSSPRSTASDDWIPLRSPDFYKDRRIELVLGSRVSALDLQQKVVKLENGKTYGFESLLIATGAEPVRLQIDAATDSQVNYLRTFADSKSIVAKGASAKRVAVVGPVALALRLADPNTHGALQWMWFLLTASPWNV